MPDRRKVHAFGAWRRYSDGSISGAVTVCGRSAAEEITTPYLTKVTCTPCHVTYSQDALESRIARARIWLDGKRDMKEASRDA